MPTGSYHHCWSWMVQHRTLNSEISHFFVEKRCRLDTYMSQGFFKIEEHIRPFWNLLLRIALLELSGTLCLINVSHCYYEMCCLLIKHVQMPFFLPSLFYHWFLISNSQPFFFFFLSNTQKFFDIEAKLWHPSWPCPQNFLQVKHYNNS